MKLIDMISLLSIAVCLYGVWGWVRIKNIWPLRWVVVLAFLINLAFLVFRSSNVFTPAELNLFSAVRVLITVLVLAVIPTSINKTL